MHVLFVHGMGRSPLSGMPILFRLRRHGYATSTFGYVAALQNFDAIRQRLCQSIARIAAHGDYVLVGHSLGGVLLRSALAQLPPTTNAPKHVFLLGSPIRPSRLAQKLRRRWIYRALTGDAGQLLASSERMAKIGALSASTTSVLGTKGIRGKYSPFLHEENDGVVAVSELTADWISEEIRVPVTHTFLPSSSRVADILIQKLKAYR